MVVFAQDKTARRKWVFSTSSQRDVETPAIESIKRLVQTGVGVAIVPRVCVRWEVERKLLAEVRIK
jgi:DNA-binding transcriptional LysR family regulator